MRRFGSETIGRVAFLVVSLCCFAQAQEASVNRSVYLRPQPSTKDPPIGTLEKGAPLSLIASRPLHGFFHARTADGREGWIGAKYVDITAGKDRGRFAAPTVPHCDSSLWAHVYNPQRLIKKQDCISATGYVMDATNGRQADGVRHEPDGDTHGWLKLDPGYEPLLNAGNMSDEDGNLVFEIVCKFRVRQPDAKSSCLGYKSPIQIPPIGSHVRITGSHVQDTNHAKWMEIHPVSNITVIP